MSRARSLEMDVEAEAKKRQKEDKTLSSMERQTNTKKSAEEKDEQEASEDIQNTTRELFPETPASYKTFYAKENRKGKEPRWNPQHANMEERTMQAKAPQTAKKETAAPNEAADLSKQLQQQI